MISDARLTFATAQRPPCVVALIGGDFTFTPCPSGFEVLGGSSLTLLSVFDLAVGHPVKARFEVTEQFDSLNDNNLARFAVVVSDSPGLTTNTQILIRSQNYTEIGLAVGVVEELVLPQQGTLMDVTHGANSTRYIGLGMEMKVPTADFTSGAVNARIVLDSEQNDFGAMASQGRNTGFTVS